VGMRPMFKTPRSGLPICNICNQPVPVETSMCDKNGEAVHQECYLRRITRQPIIARDGLPEHEES
jgi:hypothetical protein